ncbi:neural cell adhesion molecule 2-like [Chelonus insularis]|uniref:neural cell adhesion molecule 2-like n=1 Tax=Chelonus insularis TaxID=460826 RepID=UPI00158C03EF|nr:neural cell adhesion molecule 2-like [Chelonus insularis]
MINFQLCLRKSRCMRNPRHLDEALIIPLLSLWIIGSFCVKDIPISHVVAIVGHPTYLPCDISTNHDGDSVHLILWYRNDLGAAVYSIDVRGRDFSTAERWSDDSVFSNRAYFRTDQKPAKLEINPIVEKDAEIYRCRVDFLIGQTRNYKVNLTVIVPPKKISITDVNDITREKQVGPYLEGAELKLHCNVHGGKPPPTVTWYRNDKVIASEEKTVREGVIRSTIVIKNLGRQDVQSELTCSANNNNKSTPLSSTVRIDMTFPPLNVKIIGDNQPLSADKRCDLVCATSGSRPPAHVTWWLDEQRLSNSNETTSDDGNVTTSVLSFVPSKNDEGRLLSCHAENQIMGIKYIKDEWILKIHYKPETQIQLGASLNRNTIREGSDVYFDCLIHAKPGVYKVEWRHDKRTLQHNTTQGIIISNQSLVLQGVERRSAGNYTCVGYNTEGDGESSPFHLNVMFAPTCKPNQTKIHGVAKQEKANISCQVEANPPEVEFRWTFNNSAESIDVAAGHIVKSGTTSTVSYTPMTELDYGTLLCWASNTIGNQLVPCVYHIIPAGHPDMVHNCTTHNTSTSSFSVRCSEGFNGGLQQSFLLEVRESNSQEIRANITSPVPQFSVTHLDPGLLYQACIFAFNEKGRSEPMVVQAGTLRLPEKQLTSETGKSRERTRHHVKLTPMLSVMIGVVAALVIVAVIVMIVLRIQNGNPDDQGKPHLEDHDKNTKVIPIQRELRFREGCHLLTEEKHTSAFGKSLEASGELSEGDDKNPDIIPQQVSNPVEEPTEYVRKRRLQAVSTIDTSPSRSLIDQPTMQSQSLGAPGNYVGYCTIRSGMPLRELTALGSAKHKSFQPMLGEQVYGTGMCTLPRQHWPNPGGHQSLTMTMNPPVLYTSLGVATRTCPSTTTILSKDLETSTRVQQRCVQGGKDSNTTTMTLPSGPVTKRESSV